MSKYRDFAPQDRLPATWTDAIEELVGAYLSPNFRLERASASTLRIPVSGDQVSAAVDGKWRWVTTSVTAAHGGGGAGTYNIYLTTGPNAFSTDVDGFEADDTVHDFGMKLGVVPSGSGSETHSVLIGAYLWDGTTITAVTLFKDKVIEPVRLVDTSLPATNLFTGRVILYQTAGMLANEVGPWILRYDATLSGTSKWKVLSALPWVVEVETSEATATNTFTDLTTVGPTITTPAPGDWLVAISFEGAANDDAALTMSFSVGATPAVDADRVICRIQSPGSSVVAYLTISRPNIMKVAIPGGSAITAKYKDSESLGGSFAKRTLAITPLRLG